MSSAPSKKSSRSARPTPPKTASRGGAAGAGLRTRVSLLVLAAAVALVATELARRQTPRVDWSRKRGLVEWFLSPREQNAFSRPPAVTTGLLDVFPLRGTSKVWAVGLAGMILHSDDGGATWVQQKISEGGPAETPATLSAVPALSGGALFGSVWAAEAPSKNPAPMRQQGIEQKAPSPSNKPPDEEPLSRYAPPSADLYSITFINETEGWVVGEQGAFLNTRDGGSTWTRLPRPAADEKLLAVSFEPDGRTGWILGTDTLLTTEDRGGTWTSRNLERSGRFRTDGLDGWRSLAEARIPFSGNEYVNCLFFSASLDRAWIGTESGLISEYSQGVWQIRYADAKAFRREIWDIWFERDGHTGWAVGRGGLILRTKDEGRSWSEVRAGTRRDLFAIRFVDSSRGWIAGEGVVFSTVDAGATWQPQVTGAELRDLAVSESGRRAWAVGDDGLVLMTKNGGATWNVSRSVPQLDLYRVRFSPDDRNGSILGADGLLLSTTDGGASWSMRSGPEEQQASRQPLERRPPADLLNDGLHAWMSVPGDMVATSDGGRTWRPMYFPGEPDGFRFISPNQGWMFSEGGPIISTADGGRTWSDAAIKWSDSGDHRVHSMDFEPSGTFGLASGTDGTILKSTDGGKTWSRTRTGRNDDLLSATILPDKDAWTAGKGVAWATGRGGVLLHSEDSGETWGWTPSSTPADLVAIRFSADGEKGFAIGPGATIRRTSDRGRTWEDGAPYRVSPAPWYYVSWALVGLLLVPVARRPRPVVEEKKSVADELYSDKPVVDFAADRLGFGDISRGLSRFIRNENTRPPLTIGITGRWGSGKSSLMRLLEADLRERGFSPVWFNAWHHQSAESMLSALQAAVPAQAVPPLLGWHGLSFRLKLLKVRGARNWMWTIAMVAVFGAALGYVAEDPGQRLEDARSLLPLVSGDGETSPQNPILSLISVSLGLIGSLVTVRKSGAFRVDPAGFLRLFSSARTDEQVRSADQERFAEEFSKVTRALAPRTLVIMIDDLDRCSKDKVLEVLKAVNFLASNGDCIVILGMDTRYVERCVTLGFEEVADGLMEDDVPAQEEEPQPEKEKNAAKVASPENTYAKRYLEKLVNIEVRVPPLKEDQSLDLLVLGEAEKEPPTGALSHLAALVREQKDLLAGALPWALAAAVFCGGYSLGRDWIQMPPAKEDAETAAVAPGPQSDTAVQKPSQPSGRGEASPEPGRHLSAALSGPTALFLPGHTAAPSSLLRLLVFGVVLLGGFRLLCLPDVVVKDSVDFSDARSIWNSVVFARNPTPRSVKRFANRIRYVAMLQRRQAEDKGPWRRMAAWLRIGARRSRDESIPLNAPNSAIPIQGVSREKPADDPGIREDMLVALGAIHHYNSDFVAKEEYWKKVASEEAGSQDDKDWALRRVIPLAIEKHKDQFGDWPPTSRERQAFLAATTGFSLT